MQERTAFQSRWGSDLKFNWKSGTNNGNESANIENNVWKTTKTIKGKPIKVNDYQNNKKITPYVRNGLPPVVLKTAQWFYKNKPVIANSDSDEFIKIEKPQNQPIYREVIHEDTKRDSSENILDYPDSNQQEVSLLIVMQYRTQKMFTTMRINLSRLRLPSLVT